MDTEIVFALAGIDAHVKYKQKECVVLAYESGDSLYTYYIQDVSSKAIFVTLEKDIDIPFNSMDVSPLIQFRKYE